MNGYLNYIRWRKEKRRSPTKITDYDIQVCENYVYVKFHYVRLRENAPNTKYMLEKAADKHTYWCTDMNKQYNQCVLDLESRNICAIYIYFYWFVTHTRGHFDMMNMRIVAQVFFQNKQG